MNDCHVRIVDSEVLGFGTRRISASVKRRGFAMVIWWVDDEIEFSGGCGYGLGVGLVNCGSERRSVRCTDG